MKKTVSIVLLFMCNNAINGVDDSERLPTLQRRLYPRRFVVYSMATSGALLMHCGRPLERVGYLAILAAYNMHEERR